MEGALQIGRKFWTMHGDSLKTLLQYFCCVIWRQAIYLNTQHTGGMSEMSMTQRTGRMSDSV
jgi:hypothetical protein